jgi:hypothetical protein
MLVMLLGSTVASLKQANQTSTGDRDDPWIQPSGRVQVVADGADAAGGPALAPLLGPGGGQLEPTGGRASNPNGAEQVKVRLGPRGGVEAGAVEERGRPSRGPAHDFGSVRARCCRQKSSSVSGRLSVASRWAARVRRNTPLRNHRENTCGLSPARRCEPRSGRSSHPRGAAPRERANRRFTD